MSSLENISAWPVDTASAAVVTGDGVVDRFGSQDHVYQLASVTKLLSAYGALVAVEEGAIELDMPAGPPGSTVRHLLAHTSGLSFADETRVQAEPGVKRVYSNVGFDALGAMITRESGIEFADYLAEAVFEPLGMRHTVLDGAPSHAARSTAADLALFAAELLDPTLVSTETHDAATTVQFAGLDGIVPGYGMQRPCDWGLGFEIKNGKSPHWTGNSNSTRTFGHFGQSGTFLWVDPAIGAACVVLTDRDFGEWAKPVWPVINDDVVRALSL